jgi:hypothetical protein
MLGPSLEEGGPAGPLVSTAVDGDQHNAAMVGARGGRRCDRGAGGDMRWAALVDFAPERVDVSDRWPVDGARALPAVVEHQLVGRAVDVNHRRRMRRGAGVGHGGRVRTDGSEDATVAGQRVAHDAAVADSCGIGARLVDR